MKDLINVIKYRWRVAPTKIKVLDISCWFSLLVFLLWLL